MHAGAPQLLQRGLLPHRHLDHAGAAHVEGGLAVDHDHEIGQGRQVGRSRRGRPEENAHLRHHARQLDLVVEDPSGVEATGEDLDLLGDPPAGGVDQIHHGNLQARRLLLDAHDLLHGLLAPGAGLHRVVVGHDADGAPAHRSHARDDAIRRGVRLFGAREEPVLLELRARIEQEREPVADEELALGLQLVAVADVSLLDAPRSRA